MDRRSFLRGLGMVVAGVAIDQAIPLGRVWSFPSKIVHVPVYGPDGGLPYSTIALQLEKVRGALPLLYERDDRLFRMFSAEDAPTAFDPYEPIRKAAQAMFDADNGFRITGITVPQGE